MLTTAVRSTVSICFFYLTLGTDALNKEDHNALSQQPAKDETNVKVRDDVDAVSKLLQDGGKGGTRSQSILCRPYPITRANMPMQLLLEFKKPSASFNRCTLLEIG